MRDGPDCVFNGGFYRGRYQGHYRGQEGRGLIPAHTGNTFGVGVMTTNLQAHPRAYGENVLLVSRQNGKSGSSPRIRGKLGCVPVDLPNPGLIPAHTGKTTTVSTKSTKAAAHPRAYGENTC